MRRVQSALKWLYPGLRVKRWIALGFFGLLMFLSGAGVIIQAHSPETEPLAIRIARTIIAYTPARIKPATLGLILNAFGAGICLVAFGKLIQSLTSVLDPDLASGGLVDIIYQKRKLAQGRRIVVIGGGTGLSTMLRGLKSYSTNITAVVTVADDGGSSGKLQKQLGILPPGDIRNCLVALADSEPQMTELFQYRFRNRIVPVVPGVEAVEAGRTEEEKSRHPELPPAQAALPDHLKARIQNEGGYGEGLRDHSFGNLLIAAMCAINGGDFEQGVRETSRVLNIRGRVLPATVDHVRLRGEMEDGSILEGETTIASSPLKIKRVSLIPENACPIDDVIEAIELADIIVLGPGSVYTSIIPNLLVKGIPQALKRSRAKKVYVCNVMTQPGETNGFSAYDHIKALEKHAGTRVFDHVLVNTAQPNPALLAKYRKSGAVLVEPDTDRIKSEGYKPITGNFINQTDVVRHDSHLLAVAIMRLLQ